MILSHWDIVTDVGQEYTRIRFDVAKEIENEMELSITLAECEERRLYALQKNKKDGTFEGFSSTRSIIRSLKTLIYVFFGYNNAFIDLGYLFFSVEKFFLGDIPKRQIWYIC